MMRESLETIHLVVFHAQANVRLVVRNMKTPDETVSARLNLAFLIGSNLLPVLGVLFWGWSTGEIILVYWVENVIVGVVNVAKILVCQGGKHPGDEDGLHDDAQVLDSNAAETPEFSSSGDSPFRQLFVNMNVAGFFFIHYGIFTLGHGFFVYLIFFSGLVVPEGQSIHVFETDSSFPGMGFFVVTLLGLCASHWFSFFQNFIGKKQYLEVSANEQMVKPYGRIVVLHLSIILGASLLTYMGEPIYALILFVALKTVFELFVMKRQKLISLE